jgi:glucose-1-phosphate thymidylyltransferase
MEETAGVKAIVLAAGYATRLHPLTKDRPKALLPVAGQPILTHIVDEIDTLAEVDEVVIVSNHPFLHHFAKWAADRVDKGGGKPITLLDDGSTDDSNKLGAIGDMRFCIDTLSIDEDLVVIAGDNLFTYRLQDAYDFFRRTGTDTVLGKRLEDRDELRRMAVAVLDAEGRILSMVEKPQEPESDIGIFATYFYRRETLPLIRTYLDEGNKPDAPGYFPSWLYRIHEVRAYVFDGECYDIGTPKAYEQVRALFG